MGKKIAAGIGIALVAVVLFFGLVYLFQYMWNLVLPGVFGIKTITYIQAFCILFLSRMLFGGFGFRWMNHDGKQTFWKERMRAKMCNMTDEEKEEFKQRLKEKCKSW